MRNLFMLFYFHVIFALFLNGQDIAENYIEQHQLIAVQEMERTGIPASVKLAQGLLESNWGRSELAQFAHNHFGIKCGSEWMGASYYKVDDDLDENGQLRESCFRVFDSDQASYLAHSEFLMYNKRYAFLFDYASTDYKSWANGLRKAGYATDPKYPSKIIGVIKKYDLARFDYMASDELQLLAETMSPEEADYHAEQAFMASAMETDEEVQAPAKISKSTRNRTVRKKSNPNKSRKSKNKIQKRKADGRDFTKNFVEYERAWDKVIDEIDHSTNEAKRRIQGVKKKKGNLLKKWMDEIVAIGEKELASNQNKKDKKSSNSKKELSFE